MKDWLENQVTEIVLSDQKKLKEEKINEFTFGLRPNGRIIGSYISNAYRDAKYFMNPSARGQVDLMYTGSFVSKLFVRKYAKGFLFDSTDVKTGNLVGKYGGDIMGLNQEWFNERQKNVYIHPLRLEISRILNKR